MCEPENKGFKMADKPNKPAMNWEAVDLPKEWRRFKQHCEFTFKGPLAAKSEVEKVNYLMTYIGDRGRELYTTFTWAPAADREPAENDTLAGVYAKYEAHVAPQSSEIRATVKFSRCRQGNRRFDDFVTELRVLVRDCGYAEPERMLRDAIVLRSSHDQVREKCLDKGNDLTLAKAIQIGQDYEASQESMKVIDEKVDEDPKVHAVRPKQRGNGKRTPQQGAAAASKGRSQRTTPKNPKTEGECGRCGYPNTHELCPARDSICGYCKNKGHWSKKCRFNRMKTRHQGGYHRSRQSAHIVDDMTEETQYENMYLINKVDHDEATNKTREWWEQMEIEGRPIECQIDTGAAQSLLPYNDFIKLETGQKLQKSDRQFQSYTKHAINVEGYVILPTCYKDRFVNVKFYVVHVDQRPLISGHDSTKLGLISRIHTVDQPDVKVEEEYPELQHATAALPGTYSLKIDPSVPPVVHGPRRQPQALRNKISAKLDEMEQEGQIARVTEPTDWVNSMVTVVKGDSVRICLDPKDLNKAIRREHYPIPTVEEVIADFPEATVFSVLDAKSGFLQIQLDYESSLLTTFNTPQGRYRWLRLPFGVKSAPEVYQRIMDTMLEGIPGCRAVMDDILIGGKDQEEHDQILKMVIQRATEWNLRLNFKKCQIRKPKVPYCGHIVSAEGLEADPEKIRAVTEMPEPKSKEDIRRFLGIVQYLSKFLPDMSTVDAPLRDVIKHDVDFYWLDPQQKSFQKLKDMCTSAPVLARFNPAKEVTIQCDASSYGLGAALLQDERPVAFTSRALTLTEQRYAQIEKECLAILHACKRFHFYVFGRQVSVESDHKPLQSIFTKPLLAAPMRLQAMMLRLQPYDLKVKYRPGKEIPLGDALSRANLPEEEPEMEPVMVNTVDHIAVTPSRFKEFQQATANELNELYQLVLKGWPDTKQETPHAVRDYWNIRDELVVSDGVILKGMRIVVPPNMRVAMLKQIHGSHQGINKCLQRAREALYWPGMAQQIENMIIDCDVCAGHQHRQPKETLRPTKTPELPWYEVGTDIFAWEGQQYLVTIDYYSKYIEVDRLRDLSAATTIDILESQLCRHGLPMILRSDNGPQFASQEFTNFCTRLDIVHHTSSPAFPQSNGEAERAVQTVKKLWRKNRDKHLSLLNYRSTPLVSCGLSPAQLCMGRRPRNLMPTTTDLLKPMALDHTEIKRRLDQDKQRQKQNFDRHAATDLPVLQPGDPVRMQPYPGADRWLPATVVQRHQAPRSYVVEHQGRKYRRNRRQLRLSTPSSNIETHRLQRREPSPPLVPTQKRAEHTSRPTYPNRDTPDQSPVPQNPGSLPKTPERAIPMQRPETNSHQGHSTPVKTRSGRTVKPPQRLDL